MQMKLASVLENGENALQNGESVLENCENALENGENVLENGENVLENDENALHNGENALENCENALENGTVRTTTEWSVVEDQSFTHISYFFHNPRGHLASEIIVYFSQFGLLHMAIWERSSNSQLKPWLSEKVVPPCFWLFFGACGPRIRMIAASGRRTPRACPRLGIDQVRRTATDCHGLES